MKKSRTKSKREIAVAFEEITPGIAKDYLSRNVANRSLRESTVKSYARDMRADNWVATHQGIAFNDRGDLIDGQHRLTAIVRSGATVKMLVTRGLATESGRVKIMDTVDRGAARSVADQLKVQHGFRNPNRDVAAATAIVHMILGSIWGMRITVPQILSVFEIYGRHIAEIGKAMDDSQEKRLRRAQLVAALSFARAAEARLADQFLAGLISGAGLAADSPLLALRNFVFSDASDNWTSSSKKQSRTAFAYVVLNAVRRFHQAEISRDVFEGNGGYCFFAEKQCENLKRIGKIFQEKPKPIDEPDEDLRIGFALTKSANSLAARLTQSAKDIKLTPFAEDLIKRAPNHKMSGGGSVRVEYCA